MPPGFTKRQTTAPSAPGDQVGVGQHDPLWKTGRAPGVEKTRKLIAAAPLVRHRFGACDQLLIIDRSVRAFALAHPYEMAKVRIGRADLIKPRQHRLVCEEDEAAAVVERVSDLSCAPAGVDRIDDRTRPKGAQIIFMETVRIEPKIGNPIARNDAELFKTAGEARHPIGQRTISLRALPGDRGDRVRALLQATVEPLRQIHFRLLGILIIALASFSQNPPAAASDHLPR